MADLSEFIVGLHQFRHTHGTELINAGVPQHIVQKRLGHKSPEMTMRYAHIHDETMKQEMEKFWDGRVVNIKGEAIVSAHPDLDTVEMQWIKKNMKAQALPNGFCGLPITLSCPVQGSPTENLFKAGQPSLRCLCVVPSRLCCIGLTSFEELCCNPCLTCPHFRTTIEHLETHKKQLENTEKLIENANLKGWQRQVETNLTIAENLKNIIRGLESGEAHA